MFVKTKTYHRLSANHQSCTPHQSPHFVNMAIRIDFTATPDNYVPDLCSAEQLELYLPFSKNMLTTLKIINKALETNKNGLPRIGLCFNCESLEDMKIVDELITVLKKVKLVWLTIACITSDNRLSYFDFVLKLLSSDHVMERVLLFVDDQGRVLHFVKYFAGHMDKVRTTLLCLPIMSHLIYRKILSLIHSKLLFNCIT